MKWFIVSTICFLLAVVSSVIGCSATVVGEHLAQTFKIIFFAFLCLGFVNIVVNSKWSPNR